MPTYDYRCSTCGTNFELFQSFSEDALTKCPTKKSGNSPAGCTSSGRGKVAKVFSAPGITFKGSGFYKNDSRTGASTSKSSSEGSNGESKKDSAKTDSTKSDSAKKESKKSDSSATSSPSSSGKGSSAD